MCIRVYLCISVCVYVCLRSQDAGVRLLPVCACTRVLCVYVYLYLCMCTCVNVCVRMCVCARAGRQCAPVAGMCVCMCVWCT